MKNHFWKVLFGIGVLLLVCFLGGLVYLYYDYQTRTHFSYGSTPQEVYYLIHSVLFLVPSILCFILARIVRLKTSQESVKNEGDGRCY